MRLAIFRRIDAVAPLEAPRERALEGAAAAVGDLLDRQVGAGQQFLRPHVHVGPVKLPERDTHQDPCRPVEGGEVDLEVARQLLLVLEDALAQGAGDGVDDGRGGRVLGGHDRLHALPAPGRPDQSPLQGTGVDLFDRDKRDIFHGGFLFGPKVSGFWAIGPIYRAKSSPYGYAKVIRDSRSPVRGYAKVILDSRSPVRGYTKVIRDSRSPVRRYTKVIRNSHSWARGYGGWPPGPTGARCLVSEFFLQGEEEGDAFSRAAFGRDLALVEMDAVLHDREPQPRPADFPASPLVDPVEPLEDPVDVFRGDADAIVRETEIVIFGVFLVAIDRDRDVLAGVGEGIVEQVAEDGVEQGLVAPHHRLVGQLDFGFHLFLLDLARAFRQDTADQLVEVDLGQVEHVRRLLQPVEYGDVAEQQGEARALRVTALEEETQLVGRDLRVREDGLQIALDAADGRLQLVRDVLRQLPFQAALLLLPGDVVDGQLVTVVDEQDALHEEYLSALVDRNRLAQHLAIALEVADVVVQELVDRVELLYVNGLVRLIDVRVGDDINILYK